MLYEARGMRSSPNATRRIYISSRNRRNTVNNLGAGVTTEKIAQAACGKDNFVDRECIEVLLLALTPNSCNYNKTADTPGRRAFISPAQVGVVVYPKHQ